MNRDEVKEEEAEEEHISHHQRIHDEKVANIKHLLKEMKMKKKKSSSISSLLPSCLPYSCTNLCGCCLYTCRSCYSNGKSKSWGIISKCRSIISNKIIPKLKSIFVKESTEDEIRLQEKIEKTPFLFLNSSHDPINITVGKDEMRGDSRLGFIVDEVLEATFIVKQDDGNEKSVLAINSSKQQNMNSHLIKALEDGQDDRSRFVTVQSIKVNGYLKTKKNKPIHKAEGSKKEGEKRKSSFITKDEIKFLYSSYEPRFVFPHLPFHIINLSIYYIYIYLIFVFLRSSPPQK